MALTALPSLKNPAASFVQFLVKRELIKPGFVTVLSGRDFSEIDKYLLDHQLIAPAKLAENYAHFYDLPFARLEGIPILPSVVNLLPFDVASRYSVVPFKLDGLTLHLAVGEPARLQSNAPAVLAMLHRQKGLKVQLVIVPKNDVTAVLAKINQPKANLPPQEEVKALNKQDLIKEVEPRQKTVDLTTLTIPVEVLQKIPYGVAKRYQMIAFGEEKPKSQFEPPLIKIALVNPNDAKAKEILSYIESKNKVLVDQFITNKQSFDHALKLFPEAQMLPPPTEPKSVIDEKHDRDVATANLPTVTKLPAEQAQPADDKSGAAKIVEEETPTKADAPAEAALKAIASIPQAVPHPSEPKAGPTTVQGVTEGITLSQADIINKPTLGETTEELQRLAKEQENNLQSQNLDSLLRAPVTGVDELAKVFKNGVIPEIVAATLFLAIRMKASDVHIEALTDSVRVRFRIDGILHDVLSVPYFLHAPLISRIKILAKMKIDEQRIPQDGRFDVVIDNRQVDLRVSTLPTVHGEKIVMRLLDKSSAVLTLEQLGVTGTNFDTLINNINKPFGIIMSTGPTGSGKSTTLYAILTRVSKPGVNIITLEDPVEYELPGVNQSQVKPQIGFTFAEGLRSVLRQDPNIIMVGEVRDLETAAMSTHAALTGHLVLTTLHTNDAAGALPRLINMGVEPFLITSSLNCVIGQRLVRKICDHCRQKVTIPHTLLETIKRELAALPSGQMKNLNLDQLIFYHGQGCKECNGGYQGRIGIFEVLPMSSRIEELAVRKAPASEIKKVAIEEGMITMIQDGLLKALKGITTVDEVMRVTTAETKEVPGLES